MSTDVLEGLNSQAQTTSTAAENIIVENLDLWASTIKAKKSVGRGSSKKIDLYGIKKLRELILELAVRGKLVPQDPIDEPASVLLEKIANEKARLVKEKKIKKQKPLPPIGDEQKPFHLPMRWRWARLGDITNYLSQGVNTAADKVAYVDKGYKILQSKHITSGVIDDDDARHLSGSDFLEYKDRFSPRPGDILFTNIGTIGKSVIVDESKEFLVAWNLFIVRPSYFLLPKYLKTILDALDGQGAFHDLTSGSATKFVSKVSMSNLVLAIPPEAEQHRIVTKVNELMVLCDQLESQSEQSLDAHATLANTLLDALTNAQSAEELADNWQRLEQNWDILFPPTIAGERAIEKLKQTILQLAVMGKLAPQNPNDEPASVLLDKIAEEKARLVKEKKIKKQKPLPPISDEEKPFELPVGWEFKRLGDLAYVFSGNSFKSSDFNEDSGIRVIKITNVGVGELVQTEDYLPEKFIEAYSSYRVFEGDLVLALTRPYISTGLKVSPCPPAYDNSLLNQRVAAIRAFGDTEFLYQYMQSTYVLGLYQKRFSGSGLQPNLKMKDVTDLIIPVPPEREQRSIVTKVNELVTLCDTLQERIQAAQTTQLKLTDAITQQALA